MREGKVEIILNEAFYNPKAKFQRDVSVCVLSAFRGAFPAPKTPSGPGNYWRIRASVGATPARLLEVQKPAGGFCSEPGNYRRLRAWGATPAPNVLDALAATGVRGLRYAAEVGVKVVLNDKNPKAYKAIQKNIKLNKLEGLCQASNRDANILMHTQKFDIVDIDPFGSPARFLDSAARCVRSMLAVTATDTAALCGKYPKACLRKYGIRTLKTPYYPELGLRTLITATMLSLAKWNKAFIPLLSHTSEHYYRIYGAIGRNPNKVLAQIAFIFHCSCGRWYAEPRTCVCGLKPELIGPLYLGDIHQKDFLLAVEQHAREFPDVQKLVSTLIGEAGLPPFYHNLSFIASRYKVKMPKMSKIIKALQAQGYKAARTHLCPVGLKTDANLDELLKLL